MLGAPAQSWQTLLADASEAYARAQVPGLSAPREVASAAFVAEAGLAVGRALDTRVPLGLELPRVPATPRKPLTRASSRTREGSPSKASGGVGGSVPVPVTTSESEGERVRVGSSPRKRPPVLPLDDAGEEGPDGEVGVVTGTGSMSVVALASGEMDAAEGDGGFDTPGDSGEEAATGKRKKRKRGKRVGR